jgi:hypothetical protein
LDKAVYAALKADESVYFVDLIDQTALVVVTPMIYDGVEFTTF